jgi:hypothetical protein
LRHENAPHFLYSGAKRHIPPERYVPLRHKFIGTAASMPPLTKNLWRIKIETNVRTVDNNKLPPLLCHFGIDAFSCYIPNGQNLFSWGNAW